MNLSATSALVLLWTKREIHKSDIANKYLDLLDLESGKEHLDKCNEYWPHYSKVVKNRKSCILDLVKNTISQDKVEQVIILGAGFDTLSLEICSFSTKTRIFEIDIENMELKHNLINSVFTNNSITCITGDLSDHSSLISNLVEHGWNKNMPSLIIIEGLSYYLSKDELYNILDVFKTNNQHNHVILEYLLPHDKISKKWQAIAEYPFNLISKRHNLDFITRYALSDIAEYLKTLDREILGHYTMTKIQKKNTTQNNIFDSENDGWIEICEFLI